MDCDLKSFFDAANHDRLMGQLRTLRRHLLALGIPREEVHMATRSRKEYWRMSANSIVQRALTNHWLHEQGFPDMRKSWIVLHYWPTCPTKLQRSRKARV